jgi:hypothetical protein
MHPFLNSGWVGQWLLLFTCNNLYKLMYLCVCTYVYLSVPKFRIYFFFFFFFYVWWQDATLFVYFSYFMTYIHSFNHIHPSPFAEVFLLVRHRPGPE